MSTARETFLALLVAGLILALIQAPVIGATAAMGKVASAAGVSKLNGIDLTEAATLFPGDHVSIGDEGTAVVYMVGGGKIHLGSSTEASFSLRNGRIVIDLSRGGLAAAKSLKQTVIVRALGLTVLPNTSSAFAVSTLDDSVYVVAREEAIYLSARNRTLVVPAGKALKVEMAVADVTDDPLISGNGFRASGKVISNVLLGGLPGNAPVPALGFVFKELNDCDPTISPQDPDCGAGFAAN